MSESVGNAFSFAHALTKHLLHVSQDDAHNIIIGVFPRGGSWMIRVSYAGFILEKVNNTLDSTIDAVVSDLTTRITTQLEEGAKLLIAKEMTTWLRRDEEQEDADEGSNAR